MHLERPLQTLTISVLLCSGDCLISKAICGINTCHQITTFQLKEPCFLYIA